MTKDKVEGGKTTEEIINETRKTGDWLQDGDDIMNSVVPLPREPAALVAAPGRSMSVHPGQMIAVLMDRPDIDIDKLTGLFELQKKYDDEIARKAYHAARAKFSGIVPTIMHDREVDFNTTQFSFATLAGAMEQIRAALNECGLTPNWKLEELENEVVKVTCFITHELGYQEETSFSAPRSAGKGTTGMNALQAAKSTVSYLERITFFALLGLAAMADDDDGRNGGDEEAPPELISEDEANKIHAMITDNELKMPVILNWLFKVLKISSIEGVPVSMIPRVVAKINEAIALKEKAKQEKTNA